MEIKENYKLWLTQLTRESNVDYLVDELNGIEGDKDAINDRFWRNLEFGTGGLRGEIGSGTNRINIFTVGKATQGLCNYLNKTLKEPSIAIAYDTRNFSLEFAQHAATIFCANNIKTYMFDTTRPTPMLSFAVRYLHTSAGIVLTASHNPKQYNGYKVYGNDGGQITDNMAQAIIAEIENCNIFTNVKSISVADLETSEFFNTIGEDIDAPYYKKVKTLTMRNNLIAEHAADLSILYTPLHGSGNIPVRRVLKELGFANVDIVKEQELPDGNFPTTPYPNPEEPAVYKLAIEKAKTTNPDLIFATDPDCDRIGVLVKDNSGSFSVLSGNQVGALLCDYIIKTHHGLGTMPDNPAIIKTIVTSNMGKEICRKNNIFMPETLTGFKYIGELVEEWEETLEHSFLLGFEESYGYLAGDFVRDKDAVIASVLISEMALYYKSINMSLFDAIEALYKEYGYFVDKLISIEKPGQQGQQEIVAILDNLRLNYTEMFSGIDLKTIEDYKNSVSIDVHSTESSTLELPSSNVLKFLFSDGSWFVFRPSGTEPKIKIYFGTSGASQQQAVDRLNTLETLARTFLA